MGVSGVAGAADAERERHSPKLAHRIEHHQPPLVRVADSYGMGDRVEGP